MATGGNGGITPEKIEEELERVRAQLGRFSIEFGEVTVSIKKITSAMAIMLSLIGKVIFSAWFLFILVIMAFFDEQIYHAVKRVFSTVSQDDVMLVIAVLAFLLAILQTIIGVLALQTGKKALRP